MKKVHYRKLIRDGIVAKMQNKGAAFEIRTLNKKEFETCLFAKIEEEAGGIANAKTRAELIDEICDILAVIDEIKKFKKIGQAEFKTAYKENFKKKGGFTKRLWLAWSAAADYTSNEKKGKRK